MFTFSRNGCSRCAGICNNDNERKRSHFRRFNVHVFSLPTARRILDLHAEAQAVFHGQELQGQLKLGVQDDYAAKYLTPVLRNFAPRFDSVEIELNCEQSTSLIPRVENNDLDLALISRDNPNRGTLLFHEPMEVAVYRSKNQNTRKQLIIFTIY